MKSLLKRAKCLTTMIGVFLIICVFLNGLYHIPTTYTQLLQIEMPQQTIIYNNFRQILTDTLIIEPNEGYEFEHLPQENSMIDVRVKVSGFGRIQLGDQIFNFSNTSSMVFRVYFTDGQHPPYIIKFESFDRVLKVDTLEILELW